jgi:hypothetical protein
MEGREITLKLCSTVAGSTRAAVQRNSGKNRMCQERGMLFNCSRHGSKKKSKHACRNGLQDRALFRTQSQARDMKNY